MEPLPPRACDLCVYGRGPEGDRCCSHPDATRADPVPVAVVRKFGHACGPEANLLYIKSWGPLRVGIA